MFVKNSICKLFWVRSDWRLVDSIVEIAVIVITIKIISIIHIICDTFITLVRIYICHIHYSHLHHFHMANLMLQHPFSSSRYCYLASLWITFNRFKTTETIIFGIIKSFYQRHNIKQWIPRSNRIYPLRDCYFGHLDRRWKSIWRWKNQWGGSFFGTYGL